MKHSIAAPGTKSSNLDSTRHSFPPVIVNKSEPDPVINYARLKQMGEQFTDRIIEYKSAIPNYILKPRYLIPVRYPLEGEIVRCAPESTLFAPGWYTLADPATGEVYLISRNAWRRTSLEFLDAYCVPIGFALAVSSQANSFIWPYLSNFGGDLAAEPAIEEARNSWVCLNIDKQPREYHVTRQTGTFTKPKWPRLKQNDVIDIAFGNREIGSLDHPVMKRILGEVSA